MRQHVKISLRLLNREKSFVRSSLPVPLIQVSASIYVSPHMEVRSKFSYKLDHLLSVKLFSTPFSSAKPQSRSLWNFRRYSNHISLVKLSPLLTSEFQCPLLRPATADLVSQNGDRLGASIQVLSLTTHVLILWRLFFRQESSRISPRVFGL